MAGVWIVWRWNSSVGALSHVILAWPFDLLGDTLQTDFNHLVIAMIDLIDQTSRIKALDSWAQVVPLITDVLAGWCFLGTERLPI